MVTETTENGDSKYTGKGMGGTALGLGIGALGLLLLQNGAFGGIFGGNRPPMDPPATQRDLAYERELTTKDAKIGKLEAQLYTDQQINVLRQELNGAAAAQSVTNAQQNGALTMLQSQVATLNAMTSPYIKQPVMAASEAALTAFKAPAATKAAAA